MMEVGIAREIAGYLWPLALLLLIYYLWRM